MLWASVNAVLGFYGCISGLQKMAQGVLQHVPIAKNLSLSPASSFLPSLMTVTPHMRKVGAASVTAISVVQTMRRSGTSWTRTITTRTSSHRIGQRSLWLLFKRRNGVSGHTTANLVGKEWKPAARNQVENQSQLPEITFSTLGNTQRLWTFQKSETHWLQNSWLSYMLQDSSAWMWWSGLRKPTPEIVHMNGLKDSCLEFCYSYLWCCW